LLAQNIHVVAERLPIARWILRVLRDERTSVGEFRRAMTLAGILLAIESSRELSWKPITVRTPLGVETVELELERKPLLIGILGASLHMLEGFQQVYPDAPIALIAAKRRETSRGVEVDVYYERLPGEWSGPAIVVDPMLATGTTVGLAISKAKRMGSSKIIVASVIASTQGLRYIVENHQDVAVYTLAVDPELNNRYFIVPGLGDAGDRVLGVTA
jgi:uracil phosphoribosyltransferase